VDRHRTRRGGVLRRRPDVIIYGGGRRRLALSSAVWFTTFSADPQGSYLTAGASASIFGLLGALVYYGRRSGSRYVHAQAVSWALFAGVFGLILPHIDNFAHAGGFLGGYLTGRILDPLKPERINHLGLAVVCLVLSILAILVSIVEALPYVQYLQ
jgi:rhomboid protease GluP